MPGESRPAKPPAAYIFLNPDGTQELNLLVIVLATTGVTYAHQCGGNANAVREAEGFLLPLGEPEVARRLSQFFSRFRGGPPGTEVTDDAWRQEDLATLQSLVAEVPCWLTRREGEDDERLFLALDTMWANEATEGWLPVNTAYGPGILVFENSD